MHSNDLDIKVNVFGFKNQMSPEILDEITLWRSVKFIDLTHEIMFYPHENNSKIIHAL